MPLREFKIKYDNPNETYESGQQVTGTVILVIDSPKKIRGINIFILGAADTNWTEDNRELNNDGRFQDETQLVTGHEEYFKMSYYLVGAANGPEMHLPPGSHSWNFSFTLPPNLPSSFEADYGRIRYTVKAVMDRPWKFDQETKSAFTVISPLVLDNFQDASSPVQLEESKTFCCLCCGSPPLTVNINLPVRGFVPGQVIPVAVNIENQSGIVVNSFKIKLLKVVTFRVTTPRSSSKIEEKVVAEVSQGPVGEHDTSNYDQQLTVPSVPPSNLNNCRIIDLEYKLDFVAHMDGWYVKNLHFSTPIYIGTVPLSCYRTPSQMPNINYANGYPSKADEGAQVFTPSAPPLPNDYPTAPPPSYEESIYRSRNLWDRGESSDVIGAKDSFAPRYPVFNFAAFQQ